MAKKQISTYKFYPGIIPPAYDQYPNAVAAITANRTFLINEVLAYVELGASTPAVFAQSVSDLNAIALLTSNKEFIKEEVNAWIETQIAAATVGQPFYQYNYSPTIAAEFKSHVGNLVSAWIADHSGGGTIASNAETIRISRQYQLNGQDPLLSSVEEAAAYTFIKTLVATYVLPKISAPTFQDPVVAAQNTAGTAALAGAITRSQSLIDITILFRLSR
jgi:hypothetical protein